MGRQTGKWKNVSERGGGDVKEGTRASNEDKS